jgi:hypothetical protein
MPVRRFRVVVRTPEGRAREQDRKRGGDDGVYDPDLADRPPRDEGRAAERGDEQSDEEELAQLVRQVREARERLSRLIDTIQADRARWPEREQRWGRLREEVRRFHQHHDPDSKVH